MIVVIARVKPASIADTGVRPARISSRMCSKISTLASTAMPMVSTMPAMPGKRQRGACRTDIAATSMMTLTTSARLANSPNRP